MYEDGEQTADLILDTIDNTPNLLFGFTMSELMWCFLTALVITSIPCCLLSGYFFGTIMFGFILGALFSAIICFLAAQKAMFLKKDRPSYMMWLDLKRFIQDKGILGLKVNMKLIPDQAWEIQKFEKKKVRNNKLKNLKTKK